MSDTSHRHDFLDWLRVMAIAVLIFFHTGMIFVGWGWHIQNTDVIDSLRLPMDISHRLRMPVLFVIAGAGLWFAAKRRTGMQLVHERTLRLLVPVIVGMVLIVPPQVYLERLHRGQWSGDYLTFFFDRVLLFQPYPAGDTSWHHLWFIVYLFVYALLLIPIITLIRARTPRLKPGMWIYALGLLLGLNEALLKPHFPESHNLVSDWYTFNHYLLLTGYGVMLARSASGWDWLASHRWQSLIASSLLTLFIFTGFEAGWFARNTAADSLLATTFTWWWLMVMFGFGKRYLSFSNRWLVWARDASYPIYILHQTVIVALAYAIVQRPWQPWTKYWIVLIATFVICVLVYEVFIRRFAVSRWAFGMKADPTHAKSRSANAPSARVT